MFIMDVNIANFLFLLFDYVGLENLHRMHRNYVENMPQLIIIISEKENKLICLLTEEEEVRDNIFFSRFECLLFSQDPRRINMLFT